MPDKIQALARREELQRDRHELDDLVEAARSRGPEERLQLRERLFDGIEIRAIRGKKPQVRATTFDRGLHLRLLVHREVIEDDDVAGPEGRHQDLLDVRKKRRIVERSIEDRRRVEAVNTQCGHHGVGLPVAIRRVVAQPDSARAATVPTD